MKALESENEKLKEAVEVILQEIENQKDLNRQHQAEIETLLKFNERLLLIIETQLANKNERNSLQPISERSERDSDLIAPTLQSLIKSKRLAARSEKAGISTTNSLVGPKAAKLIFENEKQKSEVDHSFDNEELSEMRLEQKSAYPQISKKSSEMGENRSEMDRKVEKATVVKQQLKKQIGDLKKFKQESMKFYDTKINQIRGLSSKIGSYKPSEQLKKITQKLTLSSGTSELLNKIIKK